MLGAIALGIGFKSEKKIKEPFFWATVAVALFSAVLIWSGYAQTVEDCKELEAVAGAQPSDIDDWLEKITGVDPAEERQAAQIAALQKVFSNLAVRW